MIRPKKIGEIRKIIMNCQILNDIFMDVTESNMKWMSKRGHRLPKMDEDIEARIEMVSKLVAFVWKDVNTSVLKGLISRKLKEIIVDIIFILTCCLIMSLCLDLLMLRGIRKCSLGYDIFFTWKMVKESRSLLIKCLNNVLK
jgi:hypothetical protein